MLCPNADCPYAKKVGRPAAYRAGITACTDCGGALVEATEMPATSTSAAVTGMRKPDALPWPRHVVTALSVSVVCAIATLALGVVPLPFVDGEALSLMLGQAPGRALTAVSVGALGVMPWLTASLVVEIVAVLVPALRRRRHAGAEARGPIERAALVVGALFAAVQAWMLAVWLASLTGIYHDSVAPELWSLGPKLVLVATVVAGACVARLAAFVIDRHGVGNGLVVVTGAALVVDLADELRKQWLMISYGELTPIHIAIALAMFGVPALLAWQFVRVRPSLGGDAAFVVRPSAGIVPATVAFMVPSLAVSSASTVFLVAPSTTSMLLLGAIVALALVPLCARIWASSVRVALFRARAEGRTQPSADDVAAARAEANDARLPTFAVNGALVAALAAALLWLPLGFMNVVALVVLLAIVRDVVDEVQARRASRAHGLVSVGALHRMDLVNPLLVILARAGVTRVALRGAHVRALSHFFAPWLPVEILVDATDASEVDRARSIVRDAIAHLLDDDAPLHHGNVKETVNISEA
jgi:hypothetical protein